MKFLPNFFRKGQVRDRQSCCFSVSIDPAGEDVLLVPGPALQEGQAHVAHHQVSWDQLIIVLTHVVQLKSTGRVRLPHG